MSIDNLAEKMSGIVAIQAGRFCRLLLHLFYHFIYLKWKLREAFL